MNRLQLTHRFENSIGRLLDLLHKKYPDAKTGYWRINPARTTDEYYGETACKVVSGCWEIEVGSVADGYEIPQNDNYYIKMFSPENNRGVIFTWIAMNLLGRPGKKYRAVVYGQFAYDGNNAHIHWDGKSGDKDNALEILDAFSPTTKEYNEEFMTRFVNDFGGIQFGMERAIATLS